MTFRDPDMPILNPMPSFPGPEMILVKNMYDHWVWAVINDVPYVTPRIQHAFQHELDRMFTRPHVWN